MKALVNTWHAKIARHELPCRVLQGMLLFIPSLYLFNSKYLLAFILFSLICFPWHREKKDWPLLAFALYAAANTGFGWLSGGLASFSLFENNGILGGALIVLMYLAARTLNVTALYAFLACIVVEALAVLVQAKLGIRVFFPGQVAPYVGIPYDFFDLGTCMQMDLAAYLASPLACVRHFSEFEPHGFSRGAANLVLKLLTGLLLTLLLPMSWRARLLILLALAPVSVITNGRAALAASVTIGAVWLIAEALNRRFSLQRLAGLALCAAAATLLFFLVMNFCKADEPAASEALLQSTTQKPGDAADALSGASSSPCEGNYLYALPALQPAEPDHWLSKILVSMGRYEMWTGAYQHILQSPLIGTHSVRQPVYYAFYPNSGYLSILVIHGILGAALLGLFYLRRIWEHWPRFIMLLPLLMSAVTDDTLFSYLSYPDIIAFYILTQWRGPLFPEPGPRAKTP